MTSVYLVRHGQAGTRNAYDVLSERGRRQSRLLGEHFLSQGLHFATAYVGEMWRQQETAEEIRAAYLAGRASFPAMQVDPTWDEFDLGRLFREMAPQLCAEDPEFRREYREMLEQVRLSGDAHEAKIHRRWLPCDTKVVDAWISGRYRYGGESWEQFRERVANCRLKLGNERRHENVLVVTSAMPIAIWAGMSLEISDAHVMGLAGVLYNASYTVVCLREKQARLFTFNAAPHLAASGHARIVERTSHRRESRPWRRWGGPFSQLGSCDRLNVDLIRPIGQPEGPHIGPGGSEKCIFRNGAVSEP